MHDQLVTVLDHVEATLATAVEVVPDRALDPTAKAVRRIRSRLDYPDDIVIVALAGGTGSGKSSLFNRIVDQSLAEVGGVRPTTASSLAAVPVDRKQEIAGYLSSIGITQIETHDGPEWLALVDLPDTDSVEVDHRLHVEQLLSQIDAVAWVVDVEKYRDDTLHRGFLRRLVPYELQFVFVLNQIDRVTAAEAANLFADFTRALIEDGFRSPVVVTTAADPTLTGPKGIEELVDHLENLADGLVLSRMVVDLEESVRVLAGLIGEDPLEFDARWSSSLDAAMALLENADVTGAARLLASFFNQLGDEMSGEAAEAAHALSAHIGEKVRDVIRRAEAEIPPKREFEGGWSLRRRQPTDLSLPERLALVRDQIDAEVSSAVLPGVRQRATARASLAGLAVEIAEFRNAP